MKKLLAVLALLMVASMLLVACTPEQPPVEETTPEETTPEVTTPEETTPEDTTPEETTPEDTTPEETTPEETTPEETTPEETTPPADPVKVGQSLDECDMFIAGETVGAFFTPGQSTSWDLVATVEDYNVEAIRVWGWVAFYAETPGTFGYQIDGGDIVYDDAFSVEAEEPVVNAALAQGGKSAARMKVFVPVRDLSGEHTVKVVAKDAAGTVETIVEFTMNKAVDPTAPVFLFDPAQIATAATATGGTNHVASATVSENGAFVTLTSAEPGGDPWFIFRGVNANAQYVAIKYRTTVANKQFHYFVSSTGDNATGQGDMSDVHSYNADGKWHVDVIDISGIEKINAENLLSFLRYDFYTNGTNESIDVAWIAGFNATEYAESYFEKTTPVRPYHVDENVILGVRDGGTPFTSPSDKNFGQRYNIGENFLKKVVINDLATYSDGNQNTWTFKVWQWNKDYATTVASAPLYVLSSANHPDNSSMTVEIPEDYVITGDIYYELEYLSGSGGFTGWAAKDLAEGLETYVGGQLKEGTAYASYLTVGVKAEMNENGDTTKKFNSDVNANEIGTALGDTDLKKFFIMELPLPGSGVEAFGDGKIYNMTSINDMFAEMNGFYYISVTDNAANAGSPNYLFVRGYSVVNSDDLIANNNPANGIYKINNYYETDAIGGNGGECGGAGIYARIADGKLKVVVKYYDAEVMNRIGNYYIEVPVEGTTLTMADNGTTVSIMVNGKTYVTVDLEGETSYADINEVNPKGKFAAKATVKTIDGTVYEIENTLVAASANSQIGVVSRGGSFKFTSLSVGGYSEIEVPALEVAVSKPANGSLEQPLTVTETLAAVEGLEAGSATEDKYFTTGVVTAIGQGGSYYKNVYISDGTSEMLIYTLNPMEGMAELQVGDTITVNGFIKNYNGTIEYASNAGVYVYIVAYEAAA